MNVSKVDEIVKSFPGYIARQLAEPWSKSTRHESWRDLALQMAGERIPDEVIFRALRAWIPDADKSDAELRRAIAGAHRRSPTPATRSVSGSYDRERKVVRFILTKESKSPAELDVPVLPAEFLSKLFKPGEIICITNYSIKVGEKLIPGDAGTFWTLEKWCEEFSKRKDQWLSGEAGAWIRVNPMKPGDHSGTDASVADYRHLLVEFDSIPKEEQLRIYANSGLPIAALIDSAGKSIHAWVKVDARDQEEFKERQKLVYERLGNYIDDKSNINPSRFSRLAGIMRGGNLQRLVSFGIGPATWEEFEERIIEEASDLPLIKGPDEIDANNEPESIPVIEGVLSEGSKMFVGADSKAKKTWLMIALALCVSVGMDWLGLKCRQGKVLYLNFELKPRTFDERLAEIRRALKIDRHQVSVMNLRGKARDIANLVAETKRAITKGKFKLIILDPTYKCLGNRDENAAGDMNDFMNYLEEWCTECGVSIVAPAHFAKGNSAEKRGIDRISGSGVFARDPDAQANYVLDDAKSTEHKADVYKFEVPALREYAPVASFYIKWEFPLFARLDDSVTDSEKKDKELELQDLMDCLSKECEGEAAPGKWLEQYNVVFRADGPKMSRKTMGMRREVLRKRKWISEDGNTQKCICALSKHVIKDAETGKWRALPVITFKPAKA